MAQTPISATTVYNSTTPTTIYTVPAGRTAIVKSVLATSVVSTSDSVTLNKTSSGQTYPIIIDQPTAYALASSTYYYERETKSLNLLASPITLAAGESISISTTQTPQYKAELVVNSSTYKIINIIYLNGYYIALGIDNADSSGLILTSSDGITYTKRTTGYVGTFTNATYGNGYYVVCNLSGGAIHYSTDLATWTQVSLPTTQACYAITYGGGKFVVGGGNGASWYATTTPLSWTAATVYDTNTINAIAYIGTNYFYGTSGASYYTSDFSTFTQNYQTTAGSTGSTNGSISASADKVLSTLTQTASANPNTFLRRSSAGVTWAAQSTVANSISNYTHTHFSPNGGYIIYAYYQNVGDPLRYLASGDGITWTTQNAPISNTTLGYYCFVPFFAATNTSYNNKILGYTEANPNDGSTPPYHYISVSNINTSGVLSSNSFQGTSMTNFQPAYGWYAGSVPILIANGFDGTWKAVAYYSNGGSTTGAHYYGTTASLTSSNGGMGVNTGAGLGFVTSGGTISGSQVYLAGTTNGGIMNAANYSQNFSNVYFGNPNTYTNNPPGLTWSLVSGTAVAGFAKSGNTSTSINVIVWGNGVVAASSNQGASWTMVKSPHTTVNTQLSLNNGQPISYGNGTFYLISATGHVATSTDGITWATSPEYVQSIYNLNSQNVYIGQQRIFTSASGNVSNFTTRFLPSSNYSNRAVNRMVYIGSTYYLADTTYLYTTSDLITWDVGRTFSTLAVNNLSYMSANHYGLAYSGSGTTVAIASAYDTASSSSGKIAKPVTLNSSLFCGNAIASIVEIS